MEQDKEYWEKIRQAFYKQVKETNWGFENPSELVCKRRGRKAKPRAIAEQVLRSKTEYKQIKPTKFFNFH